MTTTYINKNSTPPRDPPPIAPPAWKRRLSAIAILAFCGLLGSGRTARADLATPRLNSVFPQGGQAGTSVEVRVTGSDLEGLAGLRFDDPRITSVPGQAQRFTVNIPKDVPPGLYDLRAWGSNGLSSPRSFFVSPRKTLLEIEPKDPGAEAQRVPLDVSLCGMIDGSGDVDAFRFHARAGQRVVIDCWAERLDSKLRPVLELRDGNGRPAAIYRDSQGADPLIDFRVPADGDYLVRIHDLTYSGGPEHVYRLDIDTRPRVEFAIPSVVEQGKQTRVTLFGRNLCEGESTENGLEFDHVSIDITPPPRGTSPLTRTFLRPAQLMDDVFPYDYPGAPSPVLLGLTDVPVLLDNGRNHQSKDAQKITWPCEISGQIAAGDEQDWYAVEARRGDVVWLDAYGERIGAPVDLDLSVFDGRGKRELIHFADELENRGGSDFPTSHLDPTGRWVVPEDGTYLFLIRNVIGGLTHNPRRLYRLGVRREEADFQLVAIPSGGRAQGGFNVERGGRALLELVSLRRRGFTQPIRVTIPDLPSGFDCPDVWFGPGVDRIPLVVSASRECGPLPQFLTVLGRADLGGVEIVRQARGGTVVSNGSPTASARLASGIPLAAGPAATWIVTATPDRTEVSQGSMIDVSMNVEVLQGQRTGPVTLTALGVSEDPGDRIALIPASESRGSISINLPNRMALGPYTFAIQADSVLKMPGASPGEKPKVVSLRTCSNTFTIQVVPGAFDLWADPRNPKKIKRGQVVQLHYRALRRNGFIGKIHTELSAPGGLVGLRARGVTFVGQTDAGTLQVIASDNAPLGQQPFLRLEAVGTVEDVPMHHAACFLDLEITN